MFFSGRRWQATQLRRSKGLAGSSPARGTNHIRMYEFHQYSSVNHRALMSRMHCVCMHTVVDVLLSAYLGDFGEIEEKQNTR